MFNENAFWGDESVEQIASEGEDEEEIPKTNKTSTMKSSED